MTIGIFLPAFLFTLIGHGLMEKIISNPSLHRFLDGVTAGVIGLIAMTAIQLCIATITSVYAIVLCVAAVGVLYRFRSKLVPGFCYPGGRCIGITVLFDIEELWIFRVIFIKIVLENNCRNIML
jgi:chromate transporter